MSHPDHDTDDSNYCEPLGAICKDLRAMRQERDRYRAALQNVLQAFADGKPNYVTGIAIHLALKP